ncbi:hypothetical protein [Pseudothioclava arenosa]|uniref:Uncharacterized protein n=1 Tax=Pseudothioclava arenosa TaxID=1795308 RepID=A0A2A4CRQ5_9RHOB|nr:hypothetical protein [Pseudothioclava arenosa]PCD77157.1 hypothetical protein CLN94_05140 [Pseudothioclava arenosa]
MQKVEVRAEGDFPAWLLWGGGAVLVALVAGLFFLTWKSQFAAPPGYLFGTPSLGAEAGYCLAVAQDVSPGGAPSGSYFDEAAQFWLGRLKGYDAPMGEEIAAGRAKLGADLGIFDGPDRVWLRDAMEVCSRRALNYGAKFRSLG